MVYGLDCIKRYHLSLIQEIYYINYADNMTKNFDKKKKKNVFKSYQKK